MTKKQNNAFFYAESTAREKTKDRTFINRYLREYRRAYTDLRASNFAKKFSPEENDGDTAFRAKMYEIKLFVSLLPSGAERTFIYYYYIKGLTMDSCAKALGISRRSVYRLKLKSLDFALKNYDPR